MQTSPTIKSKLAIDGGKPAVDGGLARFNTIGKEEVLAVATTLRAGPLSGYLGGELTGGLKVEMLEYEFAGAVGSKYAIAVNSATSGLLIACMAAGINRLSHKVFTTPFTMSATVSAPHFLGGQITFADITPNTFNLKPNLKAASYHKAAVITNLFGHPANLAWWKRAGDTHGFNVIEDNAQAPFAMEHGKYAGTIGHMGVFSFNVHKHLQAGEGGIVVTDDDDLAAKCRLARNHWELAGGGVGLNLRMTEVTAAICLAQLAKREKIIAERIEIAETLTDAVKGLPGLKAPLVREGCKHVYYCWALTVDDSQDFYLGDKRDWFVDAMVAEGVPMSKGYVEPLYHLPAFERFKTSCPNAELAHKTIALYENCAWTPTSRQLKQMKEAFHKVIDNMPKMG